MEYFLKWELWPSAIDLLDQPTAAEKVRDEKDLAAIVLSLGDDKLIHIVDKSEAKAAWHCLKAILCAEDCRVPYSSHMPNVHRIIES